MAGVWVAVTHNLSGPTRRTRLLPQSAMSTPPAPSTATSKGKRRPVLATVVMMPAGATRRMRLLMVSAM